MMLCLTVKSPCRVSPEREDLVDTDDCMETTEDESGMVLSVTNPPPSPSVWTVTLDCSKRRKIFIVENKSHTKTEYFLCVQNLQWCFHYPGTLPHYWFLQ